MIVQQKLPVTAFKPGSSYIGGDRAANCATTTAHLIDFSSKNDIGSMGKKSHTPLFTLFVYFKHLVPPTGLVWTNFSLPFKPI